MEEEIDKEEIKKCLKDANIYEENMSEDLMVGYYKAIKNSETSLQEETQKDMELAEEAEKSLNESASELLEVINQSESIAPSKRGAYIPKSDDDESLDAFSQDILNSKEANNNNNNNNNSILTDNKQEKAQAQATDVVAVKNAPFGFNDMPKSPKVDKDMLKIISHKLKFINIQNSKEFLVANSESRIIMLYNYHKAVSKLRAHYASLSTNMAPKGKPITTIDHDHCVNPVISTLKEEEIQLTNETTYISRSGRHTKRKVYVDDDFLDSPNSPTKRAKGDDEWKSTSKSASKKNESEDTASANNNNNSLSKAKIKRNESPDSSQHDVAETTEALPKPRTYQRKRLTNEEIIATNPLFRDVTTTKKSRASALVTAAKEEAEKKKQEEKEMAKFTSSLDSESQGLDDESEKIIVDDDDDEDEEVVTRRRIVPPLPFGRRSIHGQRRGGATAPEALNISAKRPNLNTTSESSVNGINRRPPRSRRVDKGEPSSSSTWSTKGKKDQIMTPCPLCSMSFPQKEIEEHAATCGEDLFPQTAAPKRITCEVCDTIVPFTTDYEVHVRACLAKKNAGG